jgi:tetratricopeptide (TPR) repeat protein
VAILVFSGHTGEDCAGNGASLICRIAGSAPAITAEISVSPQVSLNRALGFAGAANFSSALISADEVLAADPGNTSALLIKVQALDSLGRFNETAEVYDHLIAGDPGSGAFLTGKGTVLFKAGRYREALETFRQAERIEPLAEDALIGRSRSELALHLYERALASATQATWLWPGSARSWTTRGDIFLKMGRYNESLVAYTKAVSVTTGRPMHGMEQGSTPPDGKTAGSGDFTCTGRQFRTWQQPDPGPAWNCFNAIRGYSSRGYWYRKALDTDGSNRWSGPSR